MQMVLGRGLRLAAVGAIAGLAMAIGGTRLIESMLFQTSGRDLTSLISVTLLLAALVIVGSVVPALKAARVDPMTTLRTE
jgi:ABC-type antimicrobial peptide transport system permease subunit